MKYSIFLMIAFFVTSSVLPNLANAKFKVIAHRGASGYLPEHTLEAYSMAYAWGVDYIEPDLVLSKDNKIVIMHDHLLNTTTNVSKIFPKRKRSDGNYYVIDFTLKEIKRLSLHERTSGIGKKVKYKKRFPYNKSKFEIPTFIEFLELIQGLNKSTGNKIGIYPEIKAPEFHKKEGKDITKIVYEMIKKYGYENNTEQIFIQCFYPPTLIRLKNEFQTKIPLIQLIADDSWNESSVNYKNMLTKYGLKKISTYAYGIGPWLKQLYTWNGKKNDVVKIAHQLNLKVHPYTFRKDELPPFNTEASFLKSIIFDQKVDGLFSDFADVVIKFIDQTSRN